MEHSYRRAVLHKHWFEQTSGFLMETDAKVSGLLTLA
jgi:hypothetical protein